MGLVGTTFRLRLVAAIVATLVIILLLHLAFYPWPSPP